MRSPAGSLQQDAALVAEAFALPVAATYRGAGDGWQSMRAMCGPTSIAWALRSLGEEAERERLLDGTGLATLFGVRFAGMTLDQLALVVAKKSRRRPTILRDLTLDGLRAALASANDPARRLIANFDRRPLFGWGGGHHSPIGGYLPDRDLAFVLDVNRRVGPWLVEAERLHAVLTTVDPQSGRSRGLLVIE